MTYQAFMDEFSLRIVAALNTLGSLLITAGVPSNRVKVEAVESETVQDLRYRITATRGARTFTAYVEVTSGVVIDNQMAIIVTLWVEGNSVTIPSTYVSNAPAKYTDEAAMTALLDKITALENAFNGELLTASRAFLQV